MLKNAEGTVLFFIVLLAGSESQAFFCSPLNISKTQFSAFGSKSSHAPLLAGSWGFRPRPRVWSVRSAYALLA